MKTANISLRSVVIGLGLLAATAFANSAYIYVDYSDSPPWKNGTVYNVPAGADYEWEVHGSAHAIIDGGGLSVNQYGSSSYIGDAGTTAYADNISYQLNAFDSDGYALLYLGW